MCCWGWWGEEELRPRQHPPEAMVPLYKKYSSEGWEKKENNDFNSISEMAGKLSSSSSSLFWMEDCGGGSSSVWRNESDDNDGEEDETIANEKREESPRGEGNTIRRTNRKDGFTSSDGDDLINVKEVVRGLGSVIRKGLL